MKISLNYSFLGIIGISKKVPSNFFVISLVHSVVAGEESSWILSYPVLVHVDLYLGVNLDICEGRSTLTPLLDKVFLRSHHITTGTFYGVCISSR